MTLTRNVELELQINLIHSYFRTEIPPRVLTENKLHNFFSVVCLTIGVTKIIKSSGI